MLSIDLAHGAGARQSLVLRELRAMMQKGKPIGNFDQMQAKPQQVASRRPAAAVPGASGGATATDAAPATAGAPKPAGRDPAARRLRAVAAGAEAAGDTLRAARQRAAAEGAGARSNSADKPQAIAPGVSVKAVPQ